jgi:uncharacterized protein YeaO (DUF488 family)
MKQTDLDNWFQYHAPTPAQVETYNTLRAKAKEFAELFDASVPDCADKTAAMRDLRNTTMAMNLAIACYVVPQRPTIDELEKILNSEEKTPITINPDGSVTA